MSGFVGVVLMGGRSRRMGSDKALVEVEGRPMAARVADALRQAGASVLLGVGGEADQARDLDLDPVADEHPGEGPLGGLVTGLRAAGDSLSFVAACDLPWLDRVTVAALVEALETSEADGAEVAAPVVGGRPAYLCAAYRPSALAALESAFSDGERAVHRAALELRSIPVDTIDPRVLRDVDTPEELGRADRPR